MPRKRKSSQEKKEAANKKIQRRRKSVWKRYFASQKFRPPFAEIPKFQESELSSIPVVGPIATRTRNSKGMSSDSGRVESKGRGKKDTTEQGSAKKGRISNALLMEKFEEHKEAVLHIQSELSKLDQKVDEKFEVQKEAVLHTQSEYLTKLDHISAKVDQILKRPKEKGKYVNGEQNTDTDSCRNGNYVKDEQLQFALSKIEQIIKADNPDSNKIKKIYRILKIHSKRAETFDNNFDESDDRDLFDSTFGHSNDRYFIQEINEIKSRLDFIIKNQNEIFNRTREVDEDNETQNYTVDSPQEQTSNGNYDGYQIAQNCNTQLLNKHQFFQKLNQLHRAPDRTNLAKNRTIVDLSNCIMQTAEQGIRNKQNYNQGNRNIPGRVITNIEVQPSYSGSQSFDVRSQDEQNDQDDQQEEQNNAYIPVHRFSNGGNHVNYKYHHNNNSPFYDEISNSQIVVQQNDNYSEYNGNIMNDGHYLQHHQVPPPPPIMRIQRFTTKETIEEVVVD